ncbi:MAG: ABC transporter substrate-binding protein [Deinococcales bacterium]
MGSRLVAEPLTTGAGLEGELAESWEGLDGGTRWVFSLKKGIEFHNGKTMTAADVVYSLNRHRGEDTTSGAAGLMQDIKEIKATGDYEIEVILDGPNADLPYFMSDYHLLIQPEGATDDGISTGPFIFSEVEHGVRYLAVRNPNYHKNSLPYVDSFEILVINDPTARSSALQTGQVHAINRVDPKVVSFLSQSGKISVQNASGRGHFVFIMHVNTNPFDMHDVQLALKYAINRQQMLDTILRGFGSIGNDHPINAAYPLFEDAVAQREFDLDKAAFHYKRSGHSEPIILRTSDVAFPGAIEAAVLYQETAKQAGIDLQIVREPGDGYWSDVWNVKPFSTSYWRGRPTQDQMFSTAYKSDAPWNDTRFFNDKFDRLLLEARSELDSAKRVATYTQMQSLLNNEGGAIVPMFNDFLDAISNKVKGYVPHPAGMLMNGRVAEFIWLDD